MVEYIKREDAIQCACELLIINGGCTRCSEEKKVCNSVREAFAIIPAADVRPVVRARWNTVKYPLYECSNCGAVYQDVGYGFNFCPNCGADMR